MKKRFLCILLAAMMLALPSALAEGGLTGAVEAAQATQPVAPDAALPSAEVYAVEGVRLILPEGFAPVEGDALAGYTTAADFDYPGAGRTLLAAVDAQRGAALTVARVDSDMDPLDAARDAAQHLANDPDAAQTATFGENECAQFTYDLDGAPCTLSYLSDGDHLYAVATSGLTDAETASLLSSLEF